VRGGLLGNSVVPQCVRYAVCTLASALATGQPALDTNGRLHHTPPPPAALRNAHIIMRVPRSMQLAPHGKAEYRFTAFATPTRSGGWWQTRIGSARTTRQITNQIMYDERTVRAVKAAHSPAVTCLWKRWIVNPAFVEWLMGYPRDWTLAAAGRQRA
jgi:hypothetical protein